MEHHPNVGPVAGQGLAFPGEWLAVDEHLAAVDRLQPVMQRMSVDLPDPEGPSRTTTSPFSTVRSIPCSTRLVPNDELTSRISTRARSTTGAR